MMNFQQTANGRRFLSDIHRIAIALEKIAKVAEEVQAEDEDEPKKEE